MEGQLSEGAIREIRVSGEPSVHEPIVQCLSVKKVGGNGGNGDRYRAIVSDGITFQQAMFATQLNPLADDGSVTRYTLIKLLEYSVNLVKDRVILIIHQIQVLGNADNKIGEPASIDIYLQAEQEQAAANGGDVGAGKNEGGDVFGGNGAQQQQANPYNNRNAQPGGRGGAAGAQGAGGRGGAANNNNNRGPMMGNSSGQQHPIYPIEGLSPYQNKWTIKARVTNKSDIRHWSNARGEGKLFSVTFLDETGEIKATGFNDAVDQFYNLLEEGKVYFVSKARVGIAKRQFSNVNNEYEITLESSTEINLCTDTENVPQVKYNFVELGQLESVEPNSIIDVIGIVKETGEISQIVSKATQKPITKRELTLVDATGMSVRLTLWGRQAENFTAAGGYNEDGSPQQPVIAFKAVRVGDFGGRSLSMVSSSSMAVDPDIPESHALRGWFDNQGDATTFQSFNSMGGGAAGGGAAMRLDQFKLIGDVKDEMLGTGDQPDNFWIRAHVVYIKKENISYPACPTPKCAKKMMMEDTNSWRCEKCDRTFPEPEYRYILSGQVADFTGFLYFSCFNDIGQQLLGQTADEMEVLKNNDEAAFDRAIAEPVGTTWNLYVRAKSDNWQDQQRIRYNVMRAIPAQYSGEEGQKLLDLVKAYGDIQI